MKSFLLVAGAMMAWLVTAPAMAQEVQVQIGAGGLKAAAARDAAAFRASKLIGLEVKNTKGEALGSINDLVIDEQGNVRYAAVSFGGVLGVGSKLLAVPYKSFTFKSDLDAESRFAELNLDKELLEKAPGFPSDRWPNFADAKFLKEVDTFYLDLGGVKARVDRE